MHYHPELSRTNPDLILHDPLGPDFNWADTSCEWLNEHVLVQPLKNGQLFATWTSESLFPTHFTHRIKYAHSADHGKTWTPPQVLAGHDCYDNAQAAWQVPIITQSGRIYCFYPAESGNIDRPNCFGGQMRCQISDDHGRTWSPPTPIPFGRSPIDNPDPSYSCNWICCQHASCDSQNRPLMPFTRWISDAVDHPAANVPITQAHSQCELARFDNLHTDPDPQDIQITWLNTDNPITVPHESIPRASFAQEPSVVTLPDGRLFLVMRSNTGNPWYTVSDDDGVTFRPAEPIRFYDHGPKLLQPASPCPIFKLKNGHYLLLYNNNDGLVNGAQSRWDVRNRRPAFIARGEFRPNAHQPLWFSSPKLVIDNDAAPLGPPDMTRLEAAAYTSLTETNNQRILWYPDRKTFLLGKIITDQFLADLPVPQPS